MKRPRIRLYPCPWCAVTPAHGSLCGMVDEDAKAKSVRCNNCQSSGPLAPTPTEARRAWNHRRTLRRTFRVAAKPPDQ